MFFKVLEKLWCKFYMFHTQTQPFAKNLKFNSISKIHHIENIKHFLTSEEDEQMHTQIHIIVLQKNAVACTTAQVFMLGVPVLPIFLPVPFLSHNTLTTLPIPLNLV